MQEVTVAQMKELERRANAAGLTYREMMERAGAAAARCLQAHVPGLKTAAVICGKGNNGGDGLVMARYLKNAGVSVLVVLAQGEPATPDAAANRHAAEACGVRIRALDALDAEETSFLAGADALADALYGTGFSGALRAPGQRAAQLLNGGRFVLALDVPSGVCADTGEAAQGAVCADVTLAFHAPKACHRLARQCGAVEVADIGITDALGSAAP